MHKIFPTAFLGLSLLATPAPAATDCAAVNRQVAALNAFKPLLVMVFMHQTSQAVRIIAHTDVTLLVTMVVSAITPYRPGTPLSKAVERCSA